MFILIFIVSFGTKKGTLAAYSAQWGQLYKATFQSLISVTANPENFLVRFQYTALTSRTTSYVLFTFWCFFFFFGEFLLHVLFNYNTLTDSIPSSFFVYIKTHVAFMLDNNSALIGDTIFFFICLFTASALGFLVNLKYTFFYNSSRSTLFLDLALLVWFLYLFSTPALYALTALYV